MAGSGRETDTTIWLNNKLGSTDDLWSGNSICSQLSRERLLSITDCFHTLQPHVKVKLLLAILHVSKRNIEEWKEELEDMYRVACNDSDMWVSTIADILKTFPSTGFLNTEVKESQKIFHEIISDLKKLVKKHQETRMFPLECSSLSRSALQVAVGTLPQPTKHFALKRKPKSATLRVELLQKSSDAANNLKKNVSTVPVKMRSFAKKVDNDAPLKGIQQNQSHSGFLSKSNSIMGRFSGPHKRDSSSQKEGGIKLIEFDALPLSAKEMKKKRKLEMEKEKAAKKEEALSSPPANTLVNLASPPASVHLTTAPSLTMPDYAASLMPTTFEENMDTSDNRIDANENESDKNNSNGASSSQDFFTSQIILPSTNNDKNNLNLSNASLAGLNLSNLTNNNAINLNNNTLINLCNNNNVINLGNNNTSLPQTIRFALMPASSGQQAMAGPIYITQRQQNQPLVLTTPTLNQQTSRPTLVIQQPQQNITNNNNTQNPIIIKASPLINPNNIIRLNNNQTTFLSSLKNMVPGIRLVQSSQPAVQLQTMPLNLQRQQSNVQQNNIIQQQNNQLSQKLQSQQKIQQIQQNVSNQQQTNLTTEQIAEINKLFQTYKDITSHERNLILSFLSGPRVNPCPEQGPILNIRLSRSDESVQQPDGLFKPMVVETSLQLNYNTGEFKSVKKIRMADTE